MRLKLASSKATVFILLAAFVAMIGSQVLATMVR